MASPNNRLSPSEKILLSAEDQAEMLSISKPTVYRLMKMEGYPLVRIGARTLSPRRELEEWIVAHKEVLL